MRILVVDDQPALARLCELWLRRAGHEVVVVLDPQEAVDALDSTFDAVVSDIDMPGLSGVEMVRLMRAKRPELVVVFASGSDPEAELARQAAELGPVVAKDGNFRETITGITAALAGRSACRVSAA